MVAERIAGGGLAGEVVPTTTAITVAALRKAGRRALPWRSVVPRAVLVWLVSRAVLVVITALFTTGTLTDRLWHWYFWDAGWYIGIAQGGYAPSQPALAAFFPLYPLLERLAIHALPHLDVMIPVLLVANLATLGAFVAIGLFAASERRSAAAAWPAMLLLAVSPLGVFLAGAYSDGLFIALAAAALLAARRGSWTVAGVAAALAALCRPFGVALALPLVLEYASQHAWWWHLRTIWHTRSLPAVTRRGVRTTARGVLLASAPVLALGEFALVNLRQYGDPLAFVHVEDRAYGHVFRWPWQTVWLALQQLAKTHWWTYPQAHMLIDLVPPLACLAITVICARRWPVAFTAYTLLVVWICLSSPIVHASGQYAVVSDGRYCYAAIPVLLQLPGWASRRRWLLIAVSVCSLVVQILLVIVEIKHGWLV